MSKPLDEFPIGIADYLADTQHLSTIQHGAYLLLMMTMRRHGAWLPNDETKLARICKMSVAKWRQIAPDIMALLIEKDGKITQKRVLADVEKQMKAVTQNRINGAAGGHAKALKNKDVDLATAKAAPAQRQPASDSPLTHLKNNIDESQVKKKVRAKSDKGERLPSDWVPKETHYAKGAEFGFDRRRVDFFAERMRNWAGANAHRAVARKSNWDQAFHNWLSDKAEKEGSPNAKAQGASPHTKVGFSGVAARLRHRGPGADDELSSDESAGSVRPTGGQGNS
jgi:uncharacterized protein YdaU (DUF1376 family)